MNSLVNSWFLINIIIWASTGQLRQINIWGWTGQSNLKLHLGLHCATVDLGIRVHCVLQCIPEARSVCTFCTFCVCTCLFLGFQDLLVYQLCKGHSLHKHPNTITQATNTWWETHFPHFWGIQEAGFPGLPHSKSPRLPVSPSHPPSCFLQRLAFSSAHPLTVATTLPLSRYTQSNGLPYFVDQTF